MLMRMRAAVRQTESDCERVSVRPAKNLIDGKIRNCAWYASAHISLALAHVCLVTLLLLFT